MAARPRAGADAHRRGHRPRWLLLQGLLYLYAPGKLVNGMPLADGSRLVYKLNGWSSWWLT